MSGLPHESAFVVQFHADTDFSIGRVTGRVEHIASGRATRFASAAELMTFLARTLQRTPATPVVLHADGRREPE